MEILEPEIIKRLNDIGKHIEFFLRENLKKINKFFLLLTQNISPCLQIFIINFFYKLLKESKTNDGIFLLIK